MKVGIDLVKIARFNEISDHFSERVYSKNEMSEMLKAPNKPAYLASRFAAKEAFVKAVGDLSLNFEEIETLDDLTGRPHLYYKGNETGIISLSHDEDAIAIVIIEE